MIEVTVKSLFLKLSKSAQLRVAIDSANLSNDFVQAARQYLDREQVLRLTNVGQWGVRWREGTGDIPSVLFTYGGLFGFSFLCGAAYQGMTADPCHPLHIDSKVVTTTTFGLDNAIPFLVGTIACGLEYEPYRPLSHYLGNYFLHLEGQKFSTSRNHVIWAADIAKCVSKDLVRIFLASISPEQGVSNLSVDDMVAFVNTGFGERLRRSTGVRENEIREGEIGAAPERSMNLLVRLLDDQALLLLPEKLSLRDAVGKIDEWLSHGLAGPRTRTEYYWWLKGLALLGEPLMPDLCGQIWKDLGHQGRPSVSDFLEQRIPRFFPSEYRIPHTSRNEILAMVSRPLSAEETEQ